MPTVFPNGTTALKNLLAGSGAAQSDAIWEYLSLGANLPLPEGLEPPRGLTLEAKDRPIVVRTFMPDAGTHALAVGFPGGVSLAFDATRCRLAYGWTGTFLNAGPIWNDRGGNPAGVLGPRFWTSPDGFPWSFSDSPGAPPPNWRELQADPALGAPVPEGKLPESPARLHFLNYTIDKAGQPTIRYSVDVRPKDERDGREVRESFTPRQELAGVGIERRFELRAPEPETGWLLVGQTTSPPRLLDKNGVELVVAGPDAPIDQPAAGRHLALPQGPAGIQLVSVIAAPDGTRWLLRKDGDRWHAAIHLPPARSGQVARVTITVWSPYRNEQAMIRTLLSSETRK
jgi:hypothetical protein